MSLGSIGYIIGGLIDLGWVWLVSIVVGIAGFHYKLNTIDTVFFGGFITEMVVSVYLLGSMIGMSAMFLGVIPDFVIVILAFLTGGGITYITYYVSSTTMVGGKEKD